LVLLALPQQTTKFNWRRSCNAAGLQPCRHDEKRSASR
jgi:hypothetical protein